MSRHTNKPSGHIKAGDFYAHDVRSILQKYSSAKNWDDEDAQFLLKVATDGSYLSDIIEGEKRRKMFASMMDMVPELIEILYGIQQAIRRKSFRKGAATLLSAVVENYALRCEDYRAMTSWRHDREYSRWITGLTDGFWSDEAKIVAGRYEEMLHLPITAKVIEKARKYIRENKPFSGATQEELERRKDVAFAVDMRRKRLGIISPD